MIEKTDRIDMKHIDIYCLLLIYTESKEKQNFIKHFLKQKNKKL